jgi:hypothetical protein
VESTRAVARAESTPRVAEQARHETTQFENLRFIDRFDNPALTNSVWRFLAPMVMRFLPPSVSVSDGELFLTNRGYAVTKDEFPKGMDLRFRWKWLDGVGTYCDDLKSQVPRVRFRRRRS